jgi:hypothetical protein
MFGYIGVRSHSLHKEEAMNLVIWRKWFATLLLLPMFLPAANAAMLSNTSPTFAPGDSEAVTRSEVHDEGRASIANAGARSATHSDNTPPATAEAVGSTPLHVREGSAGEHSFVSAAPALTVAPNEISVVVGQPGTLTATNANGSLNVATAPSGIVATSVAESTITVTGLTQGSTTLSISDAKTTREVAVSVLAKLSVSPASVVIASGKATSLSVSNASGTVTVSNSDSSKIAASLSGNTIRVAGVAAGEATLTVRDSTTSIVVAVTVTASSSGVGTSGGGTSSAFTLVAWNDLGMHCMDADYSVFSILPPFNNLHAQLVDKRSGKIVTSGVTMSYQSEVDPNFGTSNTTSVGKTNFWVYAKDFFGELADEVGLTGHRTPSTSPQALDYDASARMFKADGIPITPYDDAGVKNTYPLVRVVSRDAAGTELASARVVLPVSDEMSCIRCHASNSDDAAKPTQGWVANETPEREYRLNILRLHDEKSGTDLYDQATSNPPKATLCAACHASNALPGTGDGVRKPLTESMHATHAHVADATSGMKLDDSANRSACYQCHPGSQTRCLRGAMSAADVQCQSCHGKMSHVGRSGRVGWLDQPNCQACHHDGKRELTAVDSNGVVKQWADSRFATNPDTPSGFSLFRMSKGHGNLQCEACHGATHAEYASTPADANLPPNHYNDNLLSQDIQGHAGTIGECSVCHKSVPLTNSGGPHGMHTIGQVWVKQHHDMMPGDHDARGCAYCHGADYRGSPLSTVKADRTFNLGERGSKSYAVGNPVSCYDCHNGPRG